MNSEHLKQSSSILIIDDDEIIRMLHRNFLQVKGHRVLEAENGEAGIALFKQEHPDLVLVDLRMPGMNGLEVLESLKTLSPDTPIIIVSGTSSMQDAVKALQLGASDFLLKPTEIEVFNHTVSRCLERSHLMIQNKAIKRQLEHKLKVIREDEEAGRKVQAQLLPSSNKSFGDFNISYRLRPSMYLSGDFVDFFKIGDDRVAFYLADVSGHGISSALVTVLLKSAVGKFLDQFRHHDDETILHPDQLCSALNAELLKADLDKHMTLFFGIIDLKKNNLSYSSAGQFPPPLFFNQKEVSQLAYQGMPIGMFDFANYPVHTLDLPSNFRLTLFSDGMLELMEEESLELKMNQLAQIVREGDVIEVVDSTSRVDGELPDDVTVLIIERNMPND